MSKPRKLAPGVFYLSEFKILVIGKRWIRVSVPARLLELAGYPLPRLYAVYAHCCDHGGQAYSCRPVWFWNRWHESYCWKKYGDRMDQGDGPDTWSRMGFFAFIRWKLELRRNNSWHERLI